MFEVFQFIFALFNSHVYKQVNVYELCTTLWVSMLEERKVAICSPSFTYIHVHLGKRVHCGYRLQVRDVSSCALDCRCNIHPPFNSHWCEMLDSRVTLLHVFTVLYTYLQCLYPFPQDTNSTSNEKSCYMVYSSNFPWRRHWSVLELKHNCVKCHQKYYLYQDWL